jgi:flagellar FliJ protein
MKRFGLAGLLRVRDLEEQRAAAELAAANRAVDAVRARGARTRASLAGVRSDAVDAATLSSVIAARTSAQVLLGELSALHELASREAVEARSAHGAARASAVSLEKLSRRHTESEAARELREEQSALDEVAIQGWRESRKDAS